MENLMETSQYLSKTERMEDANPNSLAAWLLCNTQEEESRGHLFFNCRYSKTALLALAETLKISFWESSKHTHPHTNMGWY